MFLFLVLLAFCIFLLAVFVVSALTDTAINSSIRKELAKYGHSLISVKSTKQRFTPVKKQTTQPWKKYVIMDYSTAELTRYKEVIFSSPDNKTFHSLVAIETFLFFSHKLYFETDLKTLKKNTKPV